MSLSRQILLLVTGLLLVTVLALTLFITHIYKQAYQQELHRHTQGLHLLLAETLTDKVINGKQIETEQLLKQEQQTEPEIAYLYLTDFNGRLFAHTFQEGFPLSLLDTLRYPDGEDNFLHFHTSSFTIEHFSAPLISGLPAHLYIGISNKQLQDNLQALYQQVLIASVFIFVLGVILTIITVKRISNPLKQLTNLVKRFGQGKPIASDEVPLTGSKELNLLGKSFTAMMAERQNLQIQIQSRQQFLDKLFDTSPVGLALCEMDGTLVKVNSAFARIIGYTKDEVLGLTYWQITPKCYMDQEQVQLDALRQHSRYGPYEKEYLHKDGYRVPIRLSGLLIEEEGQQYIWSSVEDISAFRKANELERRLRHIFQYSYEELYLFDGESLRFIQVSQGALNNLGYSLQEMQQLTPLDLKTDYTLSAYTHMLKPLRQGKVPILIFETRHRRKDGSFYPVDVRLQYSQNCEQTLFFAMIVDLTERKRLEKQLAEHRDHLEQLVASRTAQLQAANTELESFSYSVSHDLRSPLRAIDGFSLALIEDYSDQLDETALDYLNRVRQGAQRMSALIDDLLQLSRINKAALNWQNIDLSQLAKHIISELQATEPDRHITFIIGQNLTVKGDEKLLRIMLENLLSNAWKFTSKKTDALITFDRMGDRPEVFYIADNGAGFDMRYADKLFGAFQRLHQTSEFPGTGVGLATVQRIILRHGGKIWTEAEIDQGAAFFFTLVAQAGQTEPQQEADSKEVQHG